MKLIYPTMGEEREAPAFVAAILNCRVPRSFQSIVERAFAESGVEKIFARFFPHSHEREEFCQALRKLVDEWIDSGKEKQDDGQIVDDPWRRKANEQALRVFVKSCRVNASPRGFVLDGGRVQFRLDSPIPALMSDRRLAVGTLAIWWYVMLLDSPRRESLCRCDECGQYFLRLRMPKREAPTKRGIFCPEHKDKRKARSVNNTRQIRGQMLVELAAGFWLEWERKKPRDQLAGWIAKLMRTKLMRLQEKKRFAWVPIAISPKWVTRNKEKIEAEAERRKHGKG